MSAGATTGSGPGAPDLLGAALHYAQRGRRVVPLWWLGPDGTCACGGSERCRPGKHPRFAGWRDIATTDPAVITSWWTMNPLANIGLMMGGGTMGGVDGLVAIDVDPRNGGDETLARLEREHGTIGRTPRARTGGGGEHIFVRVKGPFTEKKLPGGIELKGDRGYVLAAPSRTVAPYEWVIAPWEAPLAWAPQWVLDTQRAEPPPSVPAPALTHVEMEHDRLIVRARAYLAAMPPAVSGSGGHQATWNAAHALVKGFGLSRDDALRLMIDEFNPRCVPPWSLKELRHKIDDAARSHAVPPWLAQASPDLDARRRWGQPGGDLSVTRAIIAGVYLDARRAADGKPALAVLKLWLNGVDGKRLLPKRTTIVAPSAGRDDEKTRKRYDAIAWDIDPGEMVAGNSALAKRVLHGRAVDVLLRDGEAKVLFRAGQEK